MTFAGLALALLSAVAINGGYAAQHRAAGSLPPLSLRRPVRSLVSLFRHGRWLAGFFAGIGGWVLYVAALALAPISLVQACSAGGIAVLAIGAGRLARMERIGKNTNLELPNGRRCSLHARRRMRRWQSQIFVMPGFHPVCHPLGGLVRLQLEAILGRPYFQLVLWRRYRFVFLLHDVGKLVRQQSPPAVVCR